MEIASRLASVQPARLPRSGFHFELPPELIAQEPAPSRSAARLLVWSRQSGAISNACVADLPSFIRPGDVLVFNDSKVIPARLYARTASGGAVELLLVRPSGGSAAWSPSAPPGAPSEQSTWQCLGRPARRMNCGTRLRFGDGTHGTVVAASGLGGYHVKFDTDDVMALMAACGETPLPPYIRRADGPLPFDRERYQTVFAMHPGAVAAPTAGLHFDAELLERLQAAGAMVAYLTLHVGPGTFLPVRVDDLADHFMDPEWSFIPPATAELINAARLENRRVIAVGTTTTRALESSVGSSGTVVAGGRWADRFIVPGYRFGIIDALFTNFHLPGSTLLALVSAFGGREAVFEVYAEAVRRRYRFYSYGDAMLIQ